MSINHEPTRDMRMEPSYSLVQIAAILVRRRAFITTVVAAAVLGVIGLHYVRGSEFEARSAFIPRSEDKATSAFAGIASYLGVATPTNTTSSPQFLTKLATAATVLRPVALAEYSYSTADSVPRKSNLLDYFDVDGDTEDERIRAAVARLQDAVSAATDLETGIVTLQVRMPSRDLAIQVNDRIVEQMSEFNIEGRQGQAQAERKFVEARLKDARRELDNAERSLEHFLARNRSYQSSPQLVFEMSRLQRDIDLKHQVYASLSQSYEQARIDEVRNTPVIQVLQNAALNVDQAGRGLFVKVFMAAILGFLLACSWVLVREYVARAREEYPADFDALVNALPNIPRRIFKVRA